MPEWIIKIRRDPGPEFVINGYTKVCSEHFKPEDFLCGGDNPQAARRMLKKTAIPSVFNWPNSSSSKECTTITSRKAALELESDSSSADEDSVSIEQSLTEADVEAIDSSSVDLNAKLAELSSQLAEMKTKYEKSLFRLANIKEDDALVEFYTGFPNYDTLLTFYKTILESDAKVMRQWRGGQS